MKEGYGGRGSVRRDEGMVGVRGEGGLGHEGCVVCMVVDGGYVYMGEGG